MLRIAFLIDFTRQLDAAINERAREFVRNNRWLGKLERRLDVFMLGTFAIAMGLDYAVTCLHCEYPSLEANLLARYLMELYGVPIGLGLTAIVSFTIVLSLPYGVYRFSKWHMSKVKLEFPALRKRGTYSILLIAAIKGVNRAFSWLQYSCPSDYTMTLDTCACLPDSDGWQTSTIRGNGAVADYPLGFVFVGIAEQVDAAVRIRFIDSLRKHRECRMVAMGSDGRIHVRDRTCKFLPDTGKRIRSATLVFSGLQLEEIEAFRFQTRPFEPHTVRAGPSGFVAVRELSEPGSVAFTGEINLHEYTKRRAVFRPDLQDKKISEQKQENPVNPLKTQCT